MTLLNDWVHEITHLCRTFHGEGCLRNFEFRTADLEAYEETTELIDLAMGEKGERSKPVRRNCGRLGRGMQRELDPHCASELMPLKPPQKIMSRFLTEKYCEGFWGRFWRHRL